RAAPEEVGTIVVRGGRPLRGVDVAGQDVVDAVDELPLLAVVAALARGTTTIRGAAELRVKESDRIAATVRLLRAFGARAEELPDGLVVEGPAALRGAAADAGGDHRLAMCAAVAASRAAGPSLLRGGEWVRISYPSFFADLDRLTGGAEGRARGERDGR
ncbi:MAG: 3-phosphoshikimate 1-carboxyvinyltransferase, partial [Candidatus Polarisedimenticolia bacterium]